MNEKPRSRAPQLALALAVVVALAASLAYRIAGGDRAFAGTARAAAAGGLVPAPRPIALAELDFPCWGCRESRQWPIRSRFDLDGLAPLGTGGENAALWLRDFAKESGARAHELVAVRERLVAGPGELGEVLPGDDPFLLEAEPWTDQATMRFYPDLLELRGAETEIPDFLIALTLAKSWVARGVAALDAEAAYDDFRRTIRWGRLLRQEDVTIIADLVGMACIRIGTEALYDRARSAGDATLALAAAVALSEIAPQRLMTSERITRVVLDDEPGALGAELEIADERIDAIVAMAESEPDRRFRGEAMLQLQLVANRAAAAQRDRARGVLEKLAGDADPIIATFAAWVLEHPYAS